MNSVAAGQQMFDFDELAREEARARLHEWTGAPLHFTVDYYSPLEFDEAFEHWCFMNSHHGAYRASHMWHRHITDRNPTELDEHRAEIFTAELRPEKGDHGPGDLLYQAVCDPCLWHELGEEAQVVEAWHDHALPGWRDLPVVPLNVRVRNETGLTKLARTWIAESYPEHMQMPGAPIITERQEYATRHVPGYSPWGGYDLSSTALESHAPTSGSAPLTRSKSRVSPAGEAVQRRIGHEPQSLPGLGI